MFLFQNGSSSHINSEIHENYWICLWLHEYLCSKIISIWDFMFSIPFCLKPLYDNVPKYIKNIQKLLVFIFADDRQS